MKRIPTQEVKRRSRKVSEHFESYSPYTGREGEEYTVLVTEESTDKRFWVGHNQFYEQILVPKESEFLGKMIQIQVTSVGKHFMHGQPLISSRKSYLELMKENLTWKQMKPQIPSWSNLLLTTCCAALTFAIIHKMVKR